MKRDGRKRTIVYFGSVCPKSLLDWYFEMKESLEKDGMPITHFSLGTETKSSSRITQVKRVEKRYVELFNKNPSDARYIEFYCIENDVEYLSSQYLICMKLKHRTTKGSQSYAMLVFDYSVLDSINIETYMDITKKYVEWNKEIIFDCGKREAPINYIINKRPWGFKEFKLISERDINEQ